jgi:hypothetical protein
MKRFFIIIVIILGALIPAAAEILTQDQALKKIQEWGPDTTAARIIALDTILQTDPVVVAPDVVVVLGMDGRLRVAFNGPVKVDVDGLLHYELTFQTWIVPDPSPDPGAWPYLIGGGVGLAGGLLLALVLSFLL